MIYLLEDDQAIREMVVYTLNNQNLEAQGFVYPSDFYSALKEELPTLIILDIMLPEEDGLSVLDSLRKHERTKNIPVMMLSAKDSDFDKVIALNNGADDYLSKPFSIMELVARVNALLRRVNQQTELHVENIVVNTANHKVYQDDKSVNLTLKEFELLVMLIEHKNTVLSRDQLLNTIWGYDFDGENRTVDVHVRSIRKKLGDDLIKTVHGVGYIIGDYHD